MFDIDKVRLDAEPLAGVCWIGHDWSHTTLAPRWRVVVPLGQSVLPAEWGNVWRRARSELYPESDQSCKGPGHFVWEEAADQYASLIVEWVSGGYLTGPIEPVIAADGARTGS